MQNGAKGGVLFVGLPLLVGCGGASSYAGTGSLSVSGATVQPLLASHSLHFDWCPEAGPAEDGKPDRSGFSILRIGDACVMEGIGIGLTSFLPDPGSVCTLVFPDGAHAIRVTDFVARSSPYYQAGTSYLYNGNYAELQLGGDDAATHTHVLYRFSGNATTDAQSPVSCEAERTKRQAALAHDGEPKGQ